MLSNKRRIVVTSTLVRCNLLTDEQKTGERHSTETATEDIPV